jgi:uncharacterized membrane protein
MIEVSSKTEAGHATRPDESSDRNLAYLVYGLLFFSLFFAGAPALVAVIIAYSRRGDVSPMIASHHRFQILIFWVSMVLALIGGISMLAALGTLIGNLSQSISHEGSISLNNFSLEVRDVHMPVATVTFASIALIATLLTGFWLVLTSIFGALRLASDRGIGQSRG